MAHNLHTNKDGKTSFAAVGQKAWHGLGQYVEQAMTAQQAINLGGLDYQVEKREIFTLTEDNESTIELPNYRAIVRADTNDVLGLVTDAFEVAAGFGAAEVAAVIVAHLEEEEVAGFHLSEGGGPVAFVDVGARGAAGDGSVGDVDARGIEELREVVAPAEVGAVAGGGVADDEDGGERGVERGAVREVGLRRCWRRSLLGEGREGQGDGKGEGEEKGPQHKANVASSWLDWCETKL